ncbi:PH domain-containing protein DDB_G0274775 [Myripristis murdjan]|uniref:Si:ch73-111k22.3 n=1 Tax=Myripristis murdjan TaxID=586833 RepID=A0A667YA91_9TELE|nr:PH domain-containing protein DDB_G0274775-like [Myripristis murdjan]
MESASAGGAEEDSSAAVKVERKGWLSKRSRFTSRWRRTWFELKDGQLLYGRSEEKPVKSIDLTGAVLETEEGPGTFGWTITTRDSKRTFHLRAGSAAEQNSWMVCVCEAQIRSTPQGANACVLQ